MRKTFIMTVLALTVVLSSVAQEQKRIMTVVQKDGNQVTYLVKNIERVTFGERVKPTLDNQWALDDKVTDIESVVIGQKANSYTVSLYRTPNPMGNVPDITITLPESLIGKNIDLASADAEGVVIYKEDTKVKPIGMLVVKFDKFGKNITVALESELEGEVEFRAVYKGTFSRSYDASSIIKITPTGGETTTKHIASAFRIQPASVGDATQLAFSDVTASTPKDVQEGKYAIWISVSASKFNNSAVDMATDADSYTFRLIDYATGTVHDKVTTGTITTAIDFAGQQYTHVVATLYDGTQVDADYLGPYADVDNLEPMIPTPVMQNGYHYYNSDGEEVNTAIIDKVLYKDKSSYMILYLYPKGSTSKYDNSRVELQFNTSMLNAGKIDLAQLKDGDMFSLKYTAGGIQLTSPDAKYGGYSNVPNNGTFTISRDNNGNYSIYLDVTNRYDCKGTNVVNGGDNTRLVVSFKGQPTGTY